MILDTGNTREGPTKSSLKFSSPRKAVIFTTHVYRSKRKAGFHWIADVLWRQGWEVVFVVCLTPVDWLKKDYRFVLVERPYGRLQYEKDRFWSYVLFNPWRPINFRIDAFNKALYKVFLQYCNLPLGSLKETLKTADLVIFESTYTIMLFSQVKSLNPKARYVYRVSDDIEIMKFHPVALDYERNIAPCFDLISTPTESIFGKFIHLPNAKLQYHGVPLNLLNAEHCNPYQPHGLHAVYVGSVGFDYDYIERVSRLFPNITFHLIGPLKQTHTRNNIIWYGEMEYLQTIPYIKHANIALSPIVYASVADSNKIQQYTFFKLPIVTSSLNHSARKNVFYYDIGDDQTVQKSLNEAIAFERATLPITSVRSWEDLVNELLSPE